MNEQRSVVSGRKSCFLKTQNDLYYSLLFPFVNRETAVCSREERVERRRWKKSILLTDLKSESFQSFFMCSPRPL